MGNKRIDAFYACLKREEIVEEVVPADFLIARSENIF
jgi:hypothetical protein